MTQRDATTHRDREIEHLQVIEGNPFDPADRAMFAEFDQLGLTPDEQRARIVDQAQAADRTACRGPLPHVPAAE